MIERALLNKMLSREEKISVQMQRLRDSIKRKHRAYETGVVESEEFVAKQLKPIVDPLKTLATVQQQQRIKKEDEYVNGGDDEDGEEEEPTTPKSLRTPISFSSPANTLIERLADTNPTKYFLQLLVTDTTNAMDHVYGVYYKNEKWMIGNKVVQFGDKTLKIGSKEYRLTSGLYSLIFEKIPKDYTNDDLSIYFKILTQTNAHLQGYDPLRQVNSNKGYKYMNVIKPLIKQHKKQGSGMLLNTANTIDYVHWDDPNELCERLRLLIASYNAGNLNHINEIHSIVEELRECGIIKGGQLHL